MGERVIVMHNGEPMWVDLDTGKRSPAGPEEAIDDAKPEVMSERDRNRPRVGGLGLSKPSIDALTQSIGEAGVSVEESRVRLSTLIDEAPKTRPLASKAVGAKAPFVTQADLDAQEQEVRQAEHQHKRGMCLITAKKAGKIRLPRAEPDIDGWIDACDDLVGEGVLVQVESEKDYLLYKPGPEWAS